MVALCTQALYKKELFIITVSTLAIIFRLFCVLELSTVAPHQKESIKNHIQNLKRVWSMSRGGFWVEIDAKKRDKGERKYSWQKAKRKIRQKPLRLLPYPKELQKLFFVLQCDSQTSQHLRSLQK